MKRDNDLVLRILRYIEKQHDGVNPLTISAHDVNGDNLNDNSKFEYHLSLLIEQGVIVSTPAGGISLTAAGHDYLDKHPQAADYDAGGGGISIPFVVLPGNRIIPPNGIDPLSTGDRCKKMIEQSKSFLDRGRVRGKKPPRHTNV